MTRGTLFSLAAAALLAAAEQSGAQVLFNQGTVDTNNSFDISSRVYADDFLIQSTTQVGGISVYLVDEAANDNGLLDSFSNVLSYTIYSDGGTRPGATRIAGGTVTTPAKTDTLLQDRFGADIVRIDIPLSVPLSLAGGIYWLAIHEGNENSPYDDSSVYWSQSPASGSGFSDPSIDQPLVFDNNETAPGGAWTAGSANAAFYLTGVPEPTSAALLLMGVPALCRRRRRA